VLGQRGQLAGSSPFADLAYMLLAAKTYAQAARSHRALGHLGSAAAATQRAREIATQCEGARTAALALLTEPSVALAARADGPAATLGVAARSKRRSNSTRHLATRSMP